MKIRIPQSAPLLAAFGLLLAAATLGSEPVAAAAHKTVHEKGCLSLYRVIYCKAQPPRGATGSKGPTGARGPTGPVGVAGATGGAGAIGATGLTGAHGVTGATGATGPSGPTGATGPAGTAPGATGAKGAAGAPGASGPTGPAGTSGSPGTTGPTGPRGEKGEPASGGVSGYEVVRESDGTVLEAGGEADLFADARCPAGKVLIGGGAHSEGVGTLLVDDGPFIQEGQEFAIWEAFGVAHNETGHPEKAVLWAVAYCVNA
jgi:hypothetical protein